MKSKINRLFGIRIFSLFMVISLVLISVISQVKADDPETIIINKTASPVEDMVNTWNIELDYNNINLSRTSDIVLVLDISGSMSGEKLRKTKSAAIQFITQLLEDGDLDTRIALVTYSQNGALVSDFKTYVERDALINSINRLFARGATNIQSGLRLSRNLLDASSADLKTIVLMSDGLPTYSYGLKSPIPDEYFEDYQGERQIKHGIPVDAYDENILTGDSSSTIRSKNTSQGPVDFYYHHGNSALNEADEIKKTSIIYSVSLELTGEATDLMENLASSADHSYNVDASDIEDVYSKIAGGIKYSASDVVITDPIAVGFKLVEGSLRSTLGSASVSDNVITWEIGSPNSEETNAKLMYTLIAVDEILTIGSVDGFYDTNGRTYGTFKNSEGFIEEKDFPYPKVKPTFLNIEKVLIDPYGNVIEDQTYDFEIMTSNEDGYIRNDFISLGVNNKLSTVEIYEFGLYSIAELGGYQNGQVLDLDVYETEFWINAELNNSFLIDRHAQEDINVLVENIDLRKVTLDANKSVEDSNGDDLVQPSEILIYTISIENTGEIESRNTLVRDSLEYLEDLVIYNLDDYLVIDGVESTYTIQDLKNGINFDIAIGDVLSIQFSVRAIDNLDTSVLNTFINTAWVNGEEIQVDIDSEVVIPVEPEEPDEEDVPLTPLEPSNPIVSDDLPATGVSPSNTLVISVVLISVGILCFMTKYRLDRRKK